MIYNDELAIHVAMLLLYMHALAIVRSLVQGQVGLSAHALHASALVLGSTACKHWPAPPDLLALAASHGGERTKRPGAQLGQREPPGAAQALYERRRRRQHCGAVRARQVGERPRSLHRRFGGLGRVLAATTPKRKSGVVPLPCPLVH